MAGDIKIGVVGDDITGCNDIGIMFAKSGLVTNIINYENAGDFFRNEADVTIINTDSRFDPPEKAYRKVFDATRLLKKQGINQFYNKTCSVFRGNIGAEFDAMLDALDQDFAVVVLGFPQNGRTTRHSIHYVDDVILAETQFRNDPMNPMKESDIRKIIKAQSQRKVDGIWYEALDKGAEYVQRCLNSLRGKTNYVCFDVRDQKDLELIAQVIRSEQVICGASAIAEEIAKYIPQNKICEMNVQDVPDKEKGIIISSGSLTKQTAAQIQYMNDKGVQVMELDPYWVFDEKILAKAQEDMIGKASGAVLEGREIVVCSKGAGQPELVRVIKREALQRDIDENLLTKMISRALAEITMGIIKSTGQHRVIVAGGDTSFSFCEAAGVESMTVYKEVVPGVPSSVTNGPNKLLVILKSGSFGGADFFERSVSHLRNI